MITYAVLAAGDSKRMGYPKAILPLAGLSPLQRIAATLGQRRFVVVTLEALRGACAKAAPAGRIVINIESWRGMTSSLRTADRAIGAGETIGVLLVDKPFVAEHTLALCERALESDGSDILYPVSRDGEAGHPVYFGQKARIMLGNLPDGDTLRTLRDEPSLTRTAIACDDEGAFLDLDTPEQWRAAAARYDS